MHLSIIIPAYNEEEIICATLRTVSEYFSGKGREFEILLVDDGSQDRTASAAGELESILPALRVLRLARNFGKGRAVLEGLRAARGQWCLYLDADSATPVSEFAAFEPYLESHDVIFGSRRLPGAVISLRQPPLRRILGRAYHWFIRRFYLDGISDAACGFKCFNQRARQAFLSRCRLSRWVFDVELLTIAQRQGLRTKELPIRWTDRKESRLCLRKDWFVTLAELARLRWNLWRGRYDAFGEPPGKSIMGRSNAPGE